MGYASGKVNLDRYGSGFGSRSMAIAPELANKPVGAFLREE
jgi:hypothetical protein